MNSKEFDSLIKKDKYQIFIFTSLCSFPFIFARHSYFVVNKKGIISRWEVLFRKVKRSTNWGHLYKDFLLPTQGIEVIPFLGIFHYKVKLLSYFESDGNSTTERIINFIENSNKNYLYCDNYSLLGPNSNTYTQWVFNNFLELNIKLPWNCFGKNYK